MFWLLCGEGCGGPFNQRGGEEAQLECRGRQDTITGGQAPSVSWKSRKASSTPGVKGSGDQGGDAPEDLSHLCAPEWGGGWKASGMVGIWGGLCGLAYSSETKSNPELRQRRRRQSTRQGHTEERNPRALPWNSPPEQGAGYRERSPARLLRQG